MSILKDGLFNHALRFLGEEHILRYPGGYSGDELPKSTSLAPATFTSQTPLINQVPVEILGEIFTHYMHSKCGRDDPKPHLSVDFGCNGNPFTLGQVCGLWRHITVMMPTLWQSLCVSEPTKGCVPLADLWLQRAGNGLLTVRLLEREKTRHGSQVLHAIVFLVVQRFCQWKHVEFDISAAYQRAFSRLPVGQATYLQYAKFDTASWDYANGDSLWRALHSSPALTHVNWGGIYRDITQLPKHVPWTQLTHINLPIASDASSTLRVLQACNNIIDVKIWGLSVPTDSLHERPILLPTLRTLYLNACDDPGPFLRSLILPNLTSLSIEHFFRPLITRSSRLSHSFRVFLEQSLCSLERFTLQDTTIHEQDLMGYLSSPYMASLTDLTIQATMTDLVIASLTDFGEDQCLLLNLRRIDFSECSTTPGTFSNMVRSRLSLLESVCVQFPLDCNVYEQDYTSLQKMQIPDLTVIL